MSRCVHQFSLSQFHTRVKSSAYMILHSRYISVPLAHQRLNCSTVLVMYMSMYSTEFGELYIYIHVIWKKGMCWTTIFCLRFIRYCRLKLKLKPRLSNTSTTYKLIIEKIIMTVMRSLQKATLHLAIVMTWEYRMNNCTMGKDIIALIYKSSNTNILCILLIHQTLHSLAWANMSSKSNFHTTLVWMIFPVHSSSTNTRGSNNEWK